MYCTEVQKLDMARYVILYQLGGVYKDMDIKCYRNLDELNSYKYNFYTGMESSYLSNDFIEVSPYHPIIKDVLHSI